MVSTNHDGSKFLVASPASLLKVTILLFGLNSNIYWTFESESFDMQLLTNSRKPRQKFIPIFASQ
jgi:hypothetical protein